MYLGENPEPKERIANPPTDVWCAQKGIDNPYTHWNGVCRGCCVFCEDWGNCRFRTCHTEKIGKPTCYHRCSPSEWMMGKIDDKAKRRRYKRRQVETWLRDGKREGDGSWEGKMITRIRERYGKDFGRTE